MDALTAVGLAANVLQFVEFGARLLSEANEIYNSTTGLSREYIDLQEIAYDLRQVTDSFILSKSGQTLTTSERTSSSRSGINSIASSARSAAEDLIAVTQKMVVPGCTQTRWRSFRQVLLTLWNKDKVEGLQKKFENLRSQLSIHILSQVSNQQIALTTDLTILRARHEELSSSRTEEVKKTLDLLRGLKDAVQEQNLQLIRQVDTALMRAKDHCHMFDKERRILESLLFDAMGHRYHTIAEAHKKTFYWIFQPSQLSPSDPRSKIRFKNWLTSGCAIYWISGKPGSGKSTLMKYICDSPNTVSCLQQWAGKEKLIVASSYFWAAGTEMQRCQRGLLQHLLFEILRQCPDFMPTLCPQRWQHNSFGDWCLTELQDAFKMLGEKTCGTRICIFIDGLDEFEGEKLELVETFQNLIRTPNIKLCVSSRPLPCFEDSFGANPDLKLYIHELTIEDIRQFACDKLEEISGFDKIQHEEHTCAEFVTEIIRRARGVFLWVFLVVRSIREGSFNGDSLSLLRARLNETPSDLEPLFDKLLNSVDSVYLEQMAIAFEVTIRAPEPMCILTYWFLDEDHAPTCVVPDGPSFPQVRAIEEKMARRLTGRYKGLLEATGLPGSRKVRFIHRTVRDYLRARTVHGLFSRPNLDAAGSAFRALLTHAEYCSGNRMSRGFNSQDFNYFLIFARWAELESPTFSWDVFNKMRSHMSTQFTDFDFEILCDAVRFGFTAYLQHYLDHHRRMIQLFERPLLEAALEIQLGVVNSVFGIQSSYDTLVWLLRHGADPNATTVNSTIFKEFLSETGAIARRSREPWAYEQWQRSLTILLQHGASIDDVFADVRLLQALPQIGYVHGSGINNLADGELLKKVRLHQGLDRHLDMYAAFLDHGLDPNRQLFSFSLWEMWLWHVCAWQSDHGNLEDICVRAVKLFLTHGADPFLDVWVPLERLGYRLRSVENIVNTFFTMEAWAETRPVLESAKEMWQERRSIYSQNPLNGH